MQCRSRRLPDHPRVHVKLTVETLARTDLQTAWTAYDTPQDIAQWNTAPEDWHTPRSHVDLREGGTFSTRMEAKDGGMGFDFEGTYARVVQHEAIDYRMADGREVAIRFSEEKDGTRVRVTFDAESQNPAEMQQQGWQAILDSFGRHAEAKGAAR